MDSSIRTAAEVVEARYDMGRIAIMGGGSWATALAKLLMPNCSRITWYMRRQDRIDEFRQLGHNPAYLSDVEFPIERIDFSDDINAVASGADTLLMAMPSPYFKGHLEKLTADISGKNVVVATKGIIPDENELITDYLTARYGVDYDHMLVVSGPCHAEEVALGHLSYLTVAAERPEVAAAFASRIHGKALRTTLSSDIRGIEYAGVLKNIYAICAGIVHGLKMGDNFQAIMVSNAINEMERFLAVAAPGERNICGSVYLGDLLVTAYSRFSRNHNFGALLGKGCSVKRAMMEMEMVTEGYYGAKCIHEINEKLKVDMPILENIHAVLYGRLSPVRAMAAISDHLE